MVDGMKMRKSYRLRGEVGVTDISFDADANLKIVQGNDTIYILGMDAKAFIHQLENLYDNERKEYQA